MDNYYAPTRVESFLVTTDIKPRDSRIFGHTDAQIREEKEKLLEAVRKKEKLNIY